MTPRPHPPAKPLPGASPGEPPPGSDAGSPSPAQGHHPDDDLRPPLGSWRRMYALVLGSLAVLILLFYLFTRAFE